MNNYKYLFKAIFFFVFFPFIILASFYTSQTELQTDFEVHNYEEITNKQRQLECLTKNVYYEAGTEPFEGKLAVAQVTINRARNENFPSDICDVVSQKSYIKSKLVCQFSWYCNNEFRNRPINFDKYQESREAAVRVFLDEKDYKTVGDSLFFHADYINPNWKRPKVVTIGHHIFYR